MHAVRPPGITVGVDHYFLATLLIIIQLLYTLGKAYDKKKTERFWIKITAAREWEKETKSFLVTVDHFWQKTANIPVLSFQS